MLYTLGAISKTRVILARSRRGPPLLFLVALAAVTVLLLYELESYDVHKAAPFVTPAAPSGSVVLRPPLSARQWSCAALFDKQRCLDERKLSGGEPSAV